MGNSRLQTHTYIFPNNLWLGYYNIWDCNCLCLLSFKISWVSLILTHVEGFGYFDLESMEEECRSCLEMEESNIYITLDYIIALLD